MVAREAASACAKSPNAEIQKLAVTSESKPAITSAINEGQRHVPSRFLRPSAHTVRPTIVAKGAQTLSTSNTDTIIQPFYMSFPTMETDALRTRPCATRMNAQAQPVATSNRRAHSLKLALALTLAQSSLAVRVTAQDANAAPGEELPPAPLPPPTNEEIPPPPPPAEVPLVTEEAEPEMVERDGVLFERHTRPRTREEELEAQDAAIEAAENALPPPPDPEFRLRVGTGIALPLSVYDVPFLRIHEDFEWQPAAVAPFVFGLSGAQYLGNATFGSVGGRIGATAFFCAVEGMRCQGGLATQIGAFFTSNSVAFEATGEGDVRLLFDAFEVHLRVGFAGAGGINMLFADLGLGAAF